jgi:GT2 family glycosyltransferase
MLANAASSSRKLLTVIVPSWHRPDLLQKCLSSLSRQTLRAQEYDIIVVENEARADTTGGDRLPANARVIALAANLGTTGSINRGLQQSSSEYVLLLNNDVELDFRFLEVMVGALRRELHAGFATPKLLNSRKRDMVDGAGDALLRGGGSYHLGHNDRDLGQFDKARCVLLACGAATLFCRSVLDEVEGLDEDFFAYLDDVDLALRAQMLGYKGIYVPEAIAYHLGSATLGNIFHPRIAEWLTRNQIYLILKDYPAGACLRLCGHIFLFQLLWLILMLRRGRLISYLRGLAGALAGAPRMWSKRCRVMNRRRISSAEFIALLTASERQIFQWQVGLPPAKRSRLLHTYFRMFKPKEVN